MAIKLQMLCVADKINPVRGKNTIRKLDGKYQNLEVGDPVVLLHTKDASGKEPMATEMATVSSLFIGSLEAVVEHNHIGNHSRLAQETMKGFAERIAKFYGGDASGPFIAIYFK